MASLAQKMPEIDAMIFDTIGDVATIGSSEVKGIFYRRYREIPTPDGALVGLDLSFDCRYSEVSSLAEGDEVKFGDDRYRFQRFVPVGGDESGLVTLDLGSFK